MFKDEKVTALNYKGNIIKQHLLSLNFSEQSI